MFIVTEYAAVNSKNMNIFFMIIDGRVSFYCNNLNLLPPKHKFTLRRKGSRISMKCLFWHLQVRLLTMLRSFEKGTILTP